MKKLITLAVAILLAWVAWGQSTDATLTTNNNTNIRGKLYSPTRAADMFESLIDNKKGFYVDGTASGTDTYAVTVSSAITAYTLNVVLRINFTNANTSTTPTLNVNSLGAKTIVNNAGAALSAGDIKAGGTYDLRYDGTNLRVLNIGGGGGGSSAISGLLAATGTNTINNADYQQDWRWNSLAGGSGLKLSSTSTAATGNTQKLFEVDLSGANATSSQTTYAAWFRNTHTGTSSTNVAGLFEASGGTNNYAISVGEGEIRKTVTTSGSPVTGIKLINFSSTGGMRQVWTNNTANESHITYFGSAHSTQADNFLFVNGSNSGSIGFFTNLGATKALELTAGGSALVGPGTITANTRLDVRGTGTGTNKGFRFADSGNTERFYIQDNGLVFVNNTFQVGSGTRYMSFSGGVSGNPFTIGNVYGTVTFGITESFSRRFYTTNGGFQGKEFHFAGSATEDTAAPSITRTSGTTGAAGLVFTADDLRIATAPANDNGLTQVLVRDGTTGAIKQRTASTLSGSEPDARSEFFTDFMEYPTNFFAEPADIFSMSGFNADCVCGNGYEFGLEAGDAAKGVLGQWMLGYDNASGAYMHIRRGTGPMYNFHTGATINIKFRIHLSSLSDATNDYEVRIGFVGPGSGGTTEPTNGAFFRYSHDIDGGNWRTVVKNGGTESTDNTGVAVSSSNYVVLEIECNAAASLITFRINGSDESTISTNIPDSADPLEVVAGIYRNAGSAVDVLKIDYYKEVITRTTARPN